MWRELETDAIIIGLSLDKFWLLTPKEYIKYTEAYKKKQKLELQTADYLNHLLGQYMSYAFNSPKEYPKKPFLYEENENKTMAVTDMERIAINNTIMMGGVIKKNDS